MRWSSAPFVLGLILAACSTGTSDTDSDANTDADTDADTDSDADTDADTDADEDSDADTEEPEDTGLGPMVGTPVTLANPSFESQNLSAEGGVYQGSMTASISIPSWTFYLGTVLSGVGVTRPNAASFNAVEPMASPADGTHVAYLDARNGEPGETSDAHLIHAVNQSVAAGETIHARMAFGTRLETSVVSPHSVVKLQIVVGESIVSETVVTMPEPGEWVDVAVAYEVPSAIDAFTVSAIAWQPDVGTVAYWQTYVDNLRVTVE